MPTFWRRIRRWLAISCACSGVALTSCDELPVTLLFPRDGDLIRPNPQQSTYFFLVSTDRPNVTYAVTIDGQPTSCDARSDSIDSGKYYTDLFCPPITSEGSHRLEVTGTDASGKRGSAAATFKVDIPLLLTVSKPSAGQWFSTNSVSVEFSSTGAAGPLSYTCRLDSGAATACTSPRVYSGLSEGPHAVVVTANDTTETATSNRIAFLVNTTGKRSVPAKQIAVGSQHTCALLTTGKVRCWGYAQGGALGYGNLNNIGDDEFPASAGDVDVGGEVVQIAAGSSHTCALLTTGKVRCWGSGRDGGLGYGNTNDIGDNETPASAGDVDVGGDVVQISAGFARTCALLATGKVRCWGRNDFGQLGYGNTNNIGDDETPASAGDVDVGGDVIQIAVSESYSTREGRTHTCALLSNGKVRCWGSGFSGALGYANTNDIGDDETPASAGDVPIGADVAQISAGTDHTCAVLANGKVRCWGDGDNHGYGTGTPGFTLASPAQDLDVVGVATEVSAGTGATCALLPTHTARCWGSFGEIPLREGTGSNSGGLNWAGYVVGDIDTGGPVEQIELGGVGCVLLTTGQVRCWGAGAALGYANPQPMFQDDGRSWVSPAQTGDVFLGFE